MPEDPKAALAALEEFARVAFGEELPPWVRFVLLLAGTLLFLALALKHISAAIVDLAESVGRVTAIARSVVHGLRKPELEQQIVRRQRFANFLQTEIRRIDLLEEWRDYRYTELEAEVEAEGDRTISRILPFLPTETGDIRREKSLSRALRTSRERLVVVEGDPGSGKSVALRHVAEEMAATGILYVLQSNSYPCVREPKGARTEPKSIGRS
jgi:transcriptional regulator of acetoin/glycerol metabolism